MAKITVTLLDILRAELRKNHDEHFNNNQLTFFNDDYAFIKKIMRMDDDVKPIVDRIFFQGLSLKNPEHDLHFKRMFINEFQYKQIKTQTVELFSSYVCSTFLQNEDYLNAIYENYNDYLTGNRKDVGYSENNNRNASQDLPQNQVNLDLNDDKFNFASVNSISKTKNYHNNDSQSFDVEKAKKARTLLKDVIDEFQKKCFLRIY